MPVIVETEELAEMIGNEEDGPVSDMAATTESDPAAKIEFHVQMRSWTHRDMVDLIVEAGARQIVGSDARRGQIGKAVEEAAIKQITALADQRLATVAAEIIDQPVTPAFGAKAPVTMREFLGLYGREYLTERVDRDGKPSKGGYHTHTYTRMELIVMQAVERKFKAEIEAATRAVVSGVQAEIKKAHVAILEEQKARIREALDKATA